jgi:glutathione S-transferase
VDLKNKPKDLLELNPYAKVPVLVDGDAIIYESAIINEYLEETYPAVQLMPSERYQRAKARIWIDFCSSRLHPPASDVRHGREPEKAKQKLATHFETLDREMSGKKYIVGDYSLADITFIPFYVRLERYGIGIDNGLSNLKCWWNDLVTRPAVASTL